MDRYDREERSYDRGERDQPGSDAGEAPGEFPWEESGGADQPAEVWEEPPADEMSGGGQQDAERNPLAIAGFILSLVMWVLVFVPYLSFVLWVLALTFSSIGLRRARKLGAPYKGLAIAGLCISLIGVVIVVLFILFLVGAAVFSST